MELGTGQAVTFWAIEYVRSPSPEGESRGLLCMPLPWEDGDTIQAAVAIFESRSLAGSGLDHYLAWTGQNPISYHLTPLEPQELIEILETRPEGEGFDHVAVNPIFSRYFRGIVSYSVGSGTEDFIEVLKRTVSIDRR